jgi:protein SCO1
MKRQLVLVVLTLTACRHATSLPYYSDRTLTPRFIADDSPVLDTLHRIGDFSFVDQRGRSVTRRTVSDKIVVASFFYASCRQLCPTLRSQLRRVQSAFRDDDGLVILSHTIAPESDSVEVLERYARQNHLDDERWLLLTGARSELERMARDDYFVELTDSGGKTNGKLLHTETFVLVDQRGRIRGVYDGSLAYDVSRLIEDIQTLRRKPRRSILAATGEPASQ